MKFTKDIYFNKRIIENSEVNILYTGKLFKSKSQKVYIVYRYGINCETEEEKEMTLSNIGFVVDIFIDGNYSFDFYFKNEEGIVDKNRNKYYSANIFPKVKGINDISNASDVDFLIKEIDGLEDEVKEKPKFEKKESLKEIKSEVKKENIKKEVKKEISKELKSEVKKISKENNKKEIKEVKKDIKKSKVTTNETSLYSVSNANKEELGKNRIKQFEDEHKEKVKIKKFIFFEKDKRRRAAVRSLCAITLFFCVGYGVSYFMERKSIQEDSQKLLDSVVVDEIAVENNVDIESEEIDENLETERMLQIKELQNQYPELKAWIEIEDTNINYPVMQGTDNTFYMNHNYKKEYSRWGALFVDKDYVWNPASSNKLIYGHNFSDGVMLSDLLKYKDEAFYLEHPTIRFTTAEEDTEYDIIAVFYSRVYYQDEEDVFRYYYFVNAENRDEYNEFINNAKAASIYNIRKAAVYGEELLTLSTCEYSSQDGRFVVVARKKY